uniref:PAAR domain-containing protein n=1 Tax=Steinernema glaseri TaxID=37863 RepID=A0A1I8AIV7_9BILA
MNEKHRISVYLETHSLQSRGSIVSLAETGLVRGDERASARKRGVQLIGEKPDCPTEGTLISGAHLCCLSAEDGTLVVSAGIVENL